MEDDEVTMKEDVLALADKVEATIGGCGECVARREDGRCLSADTFECSDAICREVTKRLREIVERDAEDVTTVSAYDLLPDEDRKAIAWVREYGGLEAVRASIHQGAMGHGCLLKVAEMLGTSIYDGTSNADALLDKLEKRLMPDGMEWLLEVWPKWSNGEYCKFGDWWTAAKYGDYEPKQLRRLGFYTPEQLKEWEQDEGDNYGYEWNFMRPSDTNYRPDKAETPASKVLAADGEPLEVGQTVYTLSDDRSYTVKFIEGDHVYINAGGAAVNVWRFPCKLTHQRPVMDADGVPIKEGDEVWSTRDSKSGTVVYAYPPGDYGQPSVKVCATWHHASDLTHAKPEPPDSWERVEEDKDLNPFDYCKKVGHKLWTFDNAEEFKASDIVRRCRALAERERGE